MLVPKIGLSALAALVCAALLFSGCSAAHYRKSADKEVYQILKKKELTVLGKTNDFNIDTEFSHRQPDDIKSLDIIHDRLFSAKRGLTLQAALDTAFATNRNYQLRKETLYLTA